MKAKGFYRGRSVSDARRLLLAALLCTCAAATLAGAKTVGPAAGATDSASSRVIDVVVGAQKQIAMGRTLQRVAVGDPAVADVLWLKSSGGANGGLLLVGKSAGRTEMMIWERGQSAPQTYTINVTTLAAHELLGSDTPAVNVLGSTAVVTGSAASMESHQRALTVARSVARTAGSSESSSGASGKGPGGQSGNSPDSSATGDGRGASTKDGDVLDVSTVATSPVVQVDVKVVEFSKAVLKEAGFNLFKQNNAFAFGTFSPSSLTSYTGGATPNLQVTSTSPISSAFNLMVNLGTRGIFANLSLLESNNLARVLAEPTLVALSGQSASFLAGGEIPIPVPQSLGTISIVYKPYGIGLTVTPTVLGPRRIALKVAPEASQLDFTHALTINGISVPAITTRRADTTVELGDGESFVIGGLIDRETASNVDKVPVLGDLPIIGAFFKTLQYTQNDRELVIIVTPHLVSPIAKGAVLPATPGEQSEQRDGPVWRSFVGGIASGDAVPGFSK
ncbi:type II and III secretion system protein family protein [Caballeronia sp. dw_19]|uniref:type II and III secretion system protein family protein n=1 Tax=Caballeronia sp. dw_19 TaxID=2719791 RepID=UPI001BCD0D3E|nr:type II and III secretion system protein family protein [Caballeronia sp. dw_19]